MIKPLTKRRGREDNVQAIQWDEQKLATVEMLAGYGLRNPEIAAFFDRSSSTFSKYLEKTPALKEAIARGKAKATAKVAETAYQMATSGNHPNMTQFWLRTQAGWVEPNSVRVVDERVDMDSLVTDVIGQLFERPSEVVDVTPPKPILLDAPKDE